MELAAKYRRISDDREGEELGVTRQSEDLDEYAAQRGYAIVDDYCDDDLSASTRSKKPRPEYERLLADAKLGKFKVIIAYTSGRLTRRPVELEGQIELAEKYGIRFEYIKSPSFDLNTADGRAIARTLAAWDAAEAERIGERVSRAALQRAKKGAYSGGFRRFGYTKDRTALVPEEATRLRKAGMDILSGVTLASAVRELQSAQVPTVTGKPWSSSSLRTMLLGPHLAGLSVHRGKAVGRGQWPAIFSDEEHHALVALLTDPRRRTSTGNQAAYLLSGWARCAVCGATVRSSGASRSERGGSVRYQYCCRARGCVARRRDWADEYITDVIVERLSRPDAADLLIDLDRPDVPALQQEANAWRLRLDGLAVEFAEGQIDRSQLRAGSERARRRLEEIQQAMRHASRAPVLAELVGADDVFATWEVLGLERRRAVAQELMDVTLHPGSGGFRDKSLVPRFVEVTWKKPS